MNGLPTRTTLSSIERLQTRVWQKLSLLRPFLIVFVLWEVVALLQVVPEQYFPAIHVIAQTLVETTASGEMITESWATLQKVVLSFVLGASVGILVGLLMGRSRVVRWFFDPLVSLSFPFPKITLMPLFILWFGTGRLPQVLLAAFACMFPVIITTYAGTRKVPKERIWSARSMGASELSIFARVIFPSSLPSVFNGIQIALPISFIIVILTEMIAGSAGLGDLLMYSARFFQTPKQYAALFVISAIGFTLDRILRVIRVKSLNWAD